jgi:hypothetical protein
MQPHLASSRAWCIRFSSSKKLSQSALEAHLSRRSPLRIEPTLEILNADLVLNLGIFDDHCNSRLTLTHVIDPTTLTERT